MASESGTLGDWESFLASVMQVLAAQTKAVRNERRLLARRLVPEDAEDAEDAKKARTWNLRHVRGRIGPEQLGAASGPSGLHRQTCNTPAHWKPATMTRQH